MAVARPKSTTISKPVVLKLRPKQQSRHFHRQRHSPYRRRSPRRTHCLHSSSMQMWNDGGHIRYSFLSCRFSAGRILRHSALNDVVRRGLSAAGIPSMLEPSGLDRGDGKRPDGITVYPYSRGRCLIWDATCVNTFASSNLIRVALAAESVADVAEVRKMAKYAELGRRFIFQPVAVKTSGAMGKSTIQFF